MIESVIIIVGVAIIVGFCAIIYSKLVDKLAELKSEVLSGCITAGLFATSVFAYSLQEWMLAGGSVTLATVTLCLSLFKVPDVHVAVPSSFFTGRIKRQTNKEDSTPIHRPYKEGLHFKPFWWTIQLFNREVQQLNIDKQDYQIGSGGTILVYGLIQYRYSAVATYRAAEIGDQEIRDGLSSELDQFIIKKLGSIEKNIQDIKDGVVDVDSGIDVAIQSRARLSAELMNRLTSTNLSDDVYDDDGNIVEGTEEKTRKLFKDDENDISYSEHGYGIEVFKARINKIDPTDEIKQERDKIQQERYQTRSQRIEMQHIMNRAQELKAIFTDLNQKEALEYIQVWQGLSTKEIKEFQIKGIETLEDLVKSAASVKNLAKNLLNKKGDS